MANRQSGIQAKLYMRNKVKTGKQNITAESYCHMLKRLMLKEGGTQTSILKYMKPLPAGGPSRAKPVSVRK